MSARHDDGDAWVTLSAILGLGAILVTAIAAEGRGPLSAAAIAANLDWQPALGLREPWRLWTAAWVHWSGAHLAVNIAGVAVLGFVGWRARAGSATTAAWCLAWPLTQALMPVAGAGLAALMPHYGGLSGVLHAGAIVLGLALAWPRAPARALAPGRAPAHTGFAPTHASMIEPSRITEGPWAMTGLEESLGQTAMAESSPDPDPAPTAEPPAIAARDRWIGLAIVGGTLLKVLLETPWLVAPRPSPALGIAVAPLAHACGVAAGALAWALLRAAWRERAGARTPNGPTP